MDEANRGPPRTHRVKVWPEPFEAALSGKRTFSLRVDDRAYRVGDELVEVEWSPTEGFTGRLIRSRVTFIARAGEAPCGALLREGACALGLSEVARRTLEDVPDTCMEGGMGQSEDCAACGGITYDHRVVDVGGRWVVLGRCRRAAKMEAELRGTRPSGTSQERA